MPYITLDQDRVGNLYMHREGDYKVWLVAGHKPFSARFVEDMKVLLAGQPLDRWRPVTALPYTAATFDGTERVGIWGRNGSEWRGFEDLELQAMPNSVALEYLGITEDEVRTYLTQREEGRPVIFVEPRQRLNVEVMRKLIGQLDAFARHLGMSRTALIEQLLMKGVEELHRQYPDVGDAIPEGN
jgi:hypothetical protein